MTMKKSVLSTREIAAMTGRSVPAIRAAARRGSLMVRGVEVVPVKVNGRFVWPV